MLCQRELITSQGDVLPHRWRQGTTAGPSWLAHRAQLSGWPSACRRLSKCKDDIRIAMTHDWTVCPWLPPFPCLWRKIGPLGSPIAAVPKQGQSARSGSGH